MRVESAKISPKISRAATPRAAAAAAAAGGGAGGGAGGTAGGGAACGTPRANAPTDAPTDVPSGLPPGCVGDAAFADPSTPPRPPLTNAHMAARAAAENFARGSSLKKDQWRAAGMQAPPPTETERG